MFFAMQQMQWKYEFLTDLSYILKLCKYNLQSIQNYVISNARNLVFIIFIRKYHIITSLPSHIMNFMPQVSAINTWKIIHKVNDTFFLSDFIQINTNSEDE